MKELKTMKSAERLRERSTGQAELSRGEQVELQDISVFEELGKIAVDQPWWLRFIRLIQDRRLGFMEQLATSVNDERTDDRTRGQISELTFIIALNTHFR